jgi:hypothetical protein
MNDGSWEVTEVPTSVVRPFIERWHYSGSINGVHVSFAFGLYRNGELQGAAIFGVVGMANAWKRYADSQDEVLELRRLCCIDDTPKNAESYFIGKCLRWLRQNSNVKTIVSYADSNYGHSGVIYKATNFDLVGATAPGKIILWNGRQYHDKTIRTKYNGRLKPYAQRVKDALESGDATYKATTPKNIYVMKFKPRRMRA